MKRSFRAVIFFMAVAFGVLFASEATIQAATWEANLNQADAYSGYVKLTWTANPEVLSSSGHYRILLSATGKDGTWQEVSYVPYSSSGTNITGLSAGYVGYAKVQAYKNSYVSSTEADLVGESTAIVVGTIPNVPRVENLKQTGATVNSIAMSWDAVPNATGYTVYQYMGYNNVVKLGDAATNSYTVTGLSASTVAQYLIIANQVTAAGVTGSSTTYSAATMRTIPGKVTGNMMYSIGDTAASYRWDRDANCNGYQFQLQNYKGKNLATKETINYYSCSVSNIAFKKGIFNKFHVRAYIIVDGKKLYGEWSDYKYFAMQTKSSSTVKRTSAKKITVKWTKIKGASGYDLYVSTVNSSTGFKKVKSLSKKKTKYVIKKVGKKKLKKNKKYYIRLVAKCKVGKKTIKSEVYFGNTLGV